MPDDAATKKLIADLRDRVARNGWTMMFVFPENEPGGDPSFCYTIGLTEKFDHPEIFLVGFNAETSAELLRNIVDRVYAGERFEEPSISERVFADYDAALRPITEESSFKRSNIGMKVLGRAFPAVQLFYPDAQGKFPWDNGCHHGLATVQTSLFDYVGEPPAPPVAKFH